MGDLGVIVEAVRAAIAYVDRELRYQVVNATYRSWFGDVRGRRFDGDHGERALRGEHVTFERRVSCLDGQERWLRAYYTPDRGPDGSVRGFVAQLEDITDRKAIDDGLAALDAATDQEAVVRAIAQLAVPVLADWAAVYLDRFGVFVPADVACAAHVSPEVAWQLARTFVPPPTTQPSIEDDKLVIPLAARGKRLAVLVLAAPSEETISRAVQLADEISRRAGTVLALARAFEQQRRANEQLRIADRRKDDFLAIVGHELRNPLSPIVTALDLMDYRGHSGCERERAVIRRQAQHMTRLVDDLLDVARIRQGKIALQRSAFELHTIVTKAIELTSPLLEQRFHQLTVDVPRGLVVDADSTRLAQVFANLLTNAAKYTPPRGHIAITASERDGTITVTVSDDGPGIRPELLDGIFDPFVQGELTLHRAEGGLGLGLSLVRSLTELHGGKVFAANHESGRGAVFTVELPATKALVSIPASAPMTMGARLLVVDDNMDAAGVLAQLLREVGYDVAVAHDAPAAIVLAEEFRPEIALLDIGLPVMDGYELARHLRAHLPSPPRLVAVTGYGDRADLDRSREAGFDVQLGKPVDFDKLVSVLGSLGPS